MDTRQTLQNCISNQDIWIQQREENLQATESKDGDQTCFLASGEIEAFEVWHG